MRMTVSLKQSFAFVVALATFLALSPFAHANHTWGNYHWARTTNSFDLQIINSMTGQWQPSFDLAVADWSVSNVLNLVPVSGSAKKTCRGKDGYVEACNAAYGYNGWLGVAQIWAQGDHIVKGVVKLNDSYYNLPDYNTDPWRNLVVCQEIGHTFGLGHQDENFNNGNLDTCMDYTNSPDSNQHPNLHDYQLLEDIYFHLDGFDSYAKADSGSTDGGGGGNGNKGGGRGKPQGVGQDIDLSDASAWGEVVSRDGRNNPSLYKRSLPNGETVFTHVYWVDGHLDHDE